MKRLAFTILLLATSFRATANPVAAFQMPDCFAQFADKQTCLYAEFNLQNPAFWKLWNADENSKQVIDHQGLVDDWLNEKRAVFQRCADQRVARILVFGKLGSLVSENLNIVFDCGDDATARQVGSWLNVGDDHMAGQFVVGQPSQLGAAWQPKLDAEELKGWKQSFEVFESTTADRTDSELQPPFKLILHLTDDQAKVLTSDTWFKPIHSFSIQLDPVNRRVRTAIRFTITTINQAENKRMALRASFGTYGKAWASRLQARLPATSKFIQEFVSHLKQTADRFQDDQQRGPGVAIIDLEYGQLKTAFDEVLGRHLLHQRDSRRIEGLATVAAALPNFRKKSDWSNDDSGIGSGDPRYSWRVGIMPQINASAYYLNQKLSWDHPDNQRATRWSPDVYPFSNWSQEQDQTKLKIVLSPAWNKPLQDSDRVFGLVINSPYSDPVTWTQPKDCSLADFENVLQQHRDNQRGIWIGLSTGQLAWFAPDQLDECRKLFVEGLESKQLNAIRENTLANHDPRYDPLDEIPDYLRRPLFSGWAVIASGMAN